MTVDEFKKLVDSRASMPNFVMTMHQARLLKKNIERLQHPQDQSTASKEQVDLHGGDF